MKFDDRYSSAVRSSNMRTRPETTQSDTDVLGAAGLAGKSHPLAFALMRLLSGENSETREVVNQLAAMADGRGFRTGVAITRIECEDMARKVLAWYRDGRCNPCNGLGYRVIEGTNVLGDAACPKCRGTGKLDFDGEFSIERLDLARWLLSKLERELALGGPAAMAKLAPRLDL